MEKPSNAFTTPGRPLFTDDELYRIRQAMNGAKGGRAKHEKKDPIARQRLKGPTK